MTPFLRTTLSRVCLTILLLVSSLFGAANAADGWRNSTQFDISIAQPTPYRVFTLTDPMRLVVDIKNHDWGDVETKVFEADVTKAVRMGQFRAEWSRLVIELEEPLVLSTSSIIEVATGHVLQIDLERSGVDRFEDVSGTPLAAMLSPTIDSPKIARDDGRLLIAIDPGHGGIDPGAIRGDVEEKTVALEFARLLAQRFTDDPKTRAVLTRDADTFVSLSERVSLAQNAQADVFVSVHANTVEIGNAEGATVFTLSEKASDKASETLAALENRADVAAGLELPAEEDDVAQMLFDMARVQTNARSRALGDDLVSVFRERIPVIRSKPHRTAGFRVLRAPDMPSVLLELGFMSNARDRERMVSPEWQAKAADAVYDAIKDWAGRDAALSKTALN